MARTGREGEDQEDYDIERSLRLLYRTLTGKKMAAEVDPHEEISRLQFSETNVRRLGFYSLAVLNDGAHRGVVRCAEDIVKLAFSQADKSFEDRVASTSLDQTKDLLFQSYVATGLTAREARAKVMDDLKSGLLGDGAN